MRDGMVASIRLLHNLRQLASIRRKSASIGDGRTKSGRIIGESFRPNRLNFTNMNRLILNISQTPILNRVLATPEKLTELFILL